MPRIAINGFGRIGRIATRVLLEREELGKIELVAVNDLAEVEQMAHLLRYDSVHGRLRRSVEVKGRKIVAGGREIEYFSELEPGKLPWKELGVDVVLECTGRNLTREKAGAHLSAGAKRVVLSAPPQEKDIPTFCLGVNDEKLDASEDPIISNASCTTNCLAPLAKVLDERFGIERGMMVTVHSYTNDQHLHDGPHTQDWRRARAGALSQIPTTTGAAKAVGLVLPRLKGKLTGYAVRVPTPNVSLVDLSVNLARPAGVELINQAVKAAAEGPLKGILRYTDEPLVSIDLTGEPASSVFDARVTHVTGDEKMAKVVSWYDNEYGYSSRLVELAARVARKAR